MRVDIELTFADLSGHDKDKAYKDQPACRARSSLESTVPSLHLDKDGLEFLPGSKSLGTESADELSEMSTMVRHYSSHQSVPVQNASGMSRN